MSQRHPNVTNADEVEWNDGPTHGSRFASKFKSLGAAAGGKGLGCTLYELQPEKRAFPMHAHLAIEEAIYVLEGEGTMRIGDREVPVRAGDYVAFPTGAQHAHQLVNTSNAVLRYLCVSTMKAPEVVLYPDSGKVAVRSVQADPGRLLFRREMAAGVGYFDGESGD